MAELDVRRATAQDSCGWELALRTEMGTRDADSIVSVLGKPRSVGHTPRTAFLARIRVRMQNTEAMKRVAQERRDWARMRGPRKCAAIFLTFMHAIVAIAPIPACFFVWLLLTALKADGRCVRPPPHGGASCCLPG